MVQSVDVRDADILHRLLLNQANPLLPLLHRSRSGTRCIEYRAHLPFRDTGVEHRLVQLPNSVGIVLAHDVEVQLQHLTNLLVEGHLRERLFYLRLQLGVTRNSKLC